MKKIHFAMAMLAVGMVCQSALAQEGKGSTAIPTVSRDVLVEALMGSAAQAPDANARRTGVQRELALQDVILGEAARAGVTQRQEVAVGMELARRQVIINAYWSDFFQRNPIPESQLHSAYDMLRLANGSRQYRLSQIFVKDDAAARRVLYEIQHKKEFSEVAKTLSEDQASRSEGGNLGWHWKTDLAPVVAEKLDAQKVGGVIGPLQMAPGVQAIIKLEESREQAFPALEQIKPAIENGMRGQMQQQESARLGKQTS
jgi:peptidyl-prolyl cis-trans isomerase C